MKSNLNPAKVTSTQSDTENKTEADKKGLDKKVKKVSSKESKGGVKELAKMFEGGAAAKSSEKDASKVKASKYPQQSSSSKASDFDSKASNPLNKQEQRSLVMDQALALFKPKHLDTTKVSAGLSGIAEQLSEDVDASMWQEHLVSLAGDYIEMHFSNEAKNNGSAGFTQEIQHKAEQFLQKALGVAVDLKSSSGVRQELIRPIVAEVGASQLSVNDKIKLQTKFARELNHHIEKRATEEGVRFPTGLAADSKTVIREALKFCFTQTAAKSSAPLPATPEKTSKDLSNELINKMTLLLETKNSDPKELQALIGQLALSVDDGMWIDHLGQSAGDYIKDYFESKPGSAGFTTNIQKNAERHLAKVLGIAVDLNGKSAFRDNVMRSIVQAINNANVLASQKLSLMSQLPNTLTERVNADKKAQGLTFPSGVAADRAGIMREAVKFCFTQPIEIKSAQEGVKAEPSPAKTEEKTLELSELKTSLSELDQESTDDDFSLVVAKRVEIIDDDDELDGEQTVKLTDIKGGKDSESEA